MSVARYSAAGSEGFAEFEGSRGCRVRVVGGFARLEGSSGWRANYLGGGGAERPGRGDAEFSETALRMRVCVVLHRNP